MFVLSIRLFYQQTCFWNYSMNFRVPLMLWSQDGSIQIRLLRCLVRMWTFLLESSFIFIFCGVILESNPDQLCSDSQANNLACLGADMIDNECMLASRVSWLCLLSVLVDVNQEHPRFSHYGPTELASAANGCNVNQPCTTCETCRWHAVFFSDDVSISLACMLLRFWPWQC